MFVQSIGVNTNIGRNNKFQRNNNPNFKGFGNTVSNAARKAFVKQSEVADVFNTLMTDIARNPEISKTGEFQHLQGIYASNGFRGLLEELRSPKSSVVTQNIIEEAQNNVPKTLATNNTGDDFLLFNLGRQGFWNELFQRKSAPRNFILNFNHALDGIYIWLDKKGCLRILQEVNSRDISETSFHIQNGNIKLKKDLTSLNHYVEIYDINGNLDEFATGLYNAEESLILKSQQSIDNPLF